MRHFGISGTRNKNSLKFGWVFIGFSMWVYATEPTGFFLGGGGHILEFLNPTTHPFSSVCSGLLNLFQLLIQTRQFCLRL